MNSLVKVTGAVLTKLVVGVVVGTIANSAAAQQDCVSIDDDGARLACFDAAFGRSLSEETEAADTGAWRKSVEKSALTDEKTFFLSLHSENDVSGQFGGPGPAALNIRCMENTTSVFFTMNGQFLADIQSYGNIDYRVDDGRMKTIRANESTSNKALGLWRGNRSIPFIKQLIGGSRLVARITPFNSNSETVTFQLSGLDNVITELRETCNW